MLLLGPDPAGVWSVGKQNILRHAGQWISRPDMILDNSWTSAGQKSSIKASLPTGADGEGREAALAAAEGGCEGLPERGDGPGWAGHGSPGTQRWLYISVGHTD